MDKRHEMSEYKAMWLFALFDLPVDTKAARKQYTQFRKALLKEGFTMLQYSVYARFCGSEEISDAHRNRIRGALPEEGQVRLMAVTDKQFGKMDVFFGNKRKKTEDPPMQLSFF